MDPDSGSGPTFHFKSILFGSHCWSFYAKLENISTFSRKHHVYLLEQFDVFLFWSRPVGLWFGLLVHRNLLDFRRDHFRLVLETIKLRFWRHLLLFLRYVFTLATRKIAIRTSQPNLILKVQKPVEVPIRLRSVYFFKIFWILSRDPVPLKVCCT